MVVLVPRVEVGDFLSGRLHFDDNLDVGEDDDDDGQDEAEEEDGHDKALASHRGLGQPPVKCAGGAEWFWSVAAPAHKRHGGPEGCVQPDKEKAHHGMTPLNPCTCKFQRDINIQLQETTVVYF